MSDEIFGCGDIAAHHAAWENNHDLDQGMQWILHQDFCNRSLEVAKIVYAARAEIHRLNDLINTPHTEEFFQAVRIEQAHQRERWGDSHDQNKTIEDWSALMTCLNAKMVSAAWGNDHIKVRHHIITLAAVACNAMRIMYGADDPIEEYQPLITAKAQDAIRELIINETFCDPGLIDGAGSDGDELEFTLSEISQGINYLHEKIETLEAELTRIKSAPMRCETAREAKKTASEV